MASTLREELVQEFQHIPDDRLEEVAAFLQRFRLELKTDSPSIKRQPSPRLAYQGARLLGDDMVPVVPPEDWHMLSDNRDGVVS